MWRTETGEARLNFVSAAASLMRDPVAFKSAMAKATVDWPFSCEHNLTAGPVNRIAWLGHAGCAVATNSPEVCTRTAWHTLTQAEQDEANRVAGEILDDWERQYHERH